MHARGSGTPSAEPHLTVRLAQHALTAASSCAVPVGLSAIPPLLSGGVLLRPAFGTMVIAPAGPRDQRKHWPEGRSDEGSANA
jgi:hypothetical protein